MNLQRQTYFSVSSEGVPIRNIADYSPFGVQLDGRTIQGDFYRYGFNKMEADNEIKGQGNSYDFGARMYDSRVGRWLTIDPLARKQPAHSAYKSFLNNPLYFIDPEGETEYSIHIYYNEKTGKTKVKIKVASNDVMTDGKKHTVWSSQASSHLENFYYDFAVITVFTINKNGVTSISIPENIILKENGIKDRDYVLLGGDKPFDTHSEWKASKDIGREVSWGIGMGGSTGGAEVIGQDWSKNTIGDIDFGDLATILGRSSYSPKAIKWGQVDFTKPAKVAEKVIEQYKNIDDATEKASEFNENVIYKPDSCVDCCQTGSKDGNLKGHNVVRRIEKSTKNK